MKHQDGLELYVVGTRKQRKVSKQVADFLQQHHLTYRLIQVKQSFPMSFSEFCEVLAWTNKATRDKEILALTMSEQQHRLFSQPNKVTGPIIVQCVIMKLLKQSLGLLIWKCLFLKMSGIAIYVQHWMNYSVLTCVNMPRQTMKKQLFDRRIADGD